MHLGILPRHFVLTYTHSAYDTISHCSLVVFAVYYETPLCMCMYMYVCMCIYTYMYTLTHIITPMTRCQQQLGRLCCVLRNKTAVYAYMRICTRTHTHAIHDQYVLHELYNLYTLTRHEHAKTITTRQITVTSHAHLLSFDTYSLRLAIDATRIHTYIYINKLYTYCICTYTLHTLTHILSWFHACS
jgi:hypothetical protein